MLVDEYTDIVTAVAAVHKDLHYESLDEEIFDFDLARIHLKRLRLHLNDDDGNKTYGGPREIAFDNLIAPSDPTVVVRVKGDSLGFYDAEYLDVLADLNWDMYDTYIHITPALRKKYPGLAVDKYKKKINLRTFVYVFLKQQDLPEGAEVAPLNYIATDARVSNMIVVPQTGRGQKPTVDNTMPNDLVQATGLAYLPRGVSINTEGGSGNRLFAVKVFGKVHRFSFSSSNGGAVFSTKVIPLLQKCQPDFHEKNALYQNACSSYKELHAMFMRWRV